MTRSILSAAGAVTLAMAAGARLVRIEKEEPQPLREPEQFSRLAIINSRLRGQVSHSENSSRARRLRQEIRKLMKDQGLWADFLADGHEHKLKNASLEQLLEIKKDLLG